MLAKKTIIGLGHSAEQRRDKRRRDPTVVAVLDGASYVAGNWSLGGLLLSDYYGGRGPGAEVAGELRLARGFECHGFTAVVARRDLRTGDAALEFTELSEGAFALLEGAALEVERQA